MRLGDLPNVLISAGIAIFILIAFIPLFQELNVNADFISLFIIGLIIITIFTVIAAIKNVF